MAESIENNEVANNVGNTADENTQFSRENEYDEFRQALEVVNAEYLQEESESEKGEKDGTQMIVAEEKPQENTDGDSDLAKVEDSEQEESNDSKEEQEVQEQYKEYKVNKIYSKINYDLSSPELVISKLKTCIADGLKYNFNCFVVLTSKVKALKKHFKGDANFGVKIGLGESTLSARCCEIRQAKWLKVKEIEVIVPLSLIKEGKKRLLVKELTKCKRVAGKKAIFKASIDGALLTPEEFNFVVECAILAKVKRIVLLNFDKISSAYLLNLAKRCIGKCEIELDSDVTNLEKFREFTDRGVDYFLLKNAVAVAESVKLD